MMNSAAFQLNKVRRAINTNGDWIPFYKPKLNEFKEPTDEMCCMMIKGLFHESTSFIQTTASTTEGSTMRKKSSPMVLCPWEDAMKIAESKYVQYRCRRYRVTEIKNLMEAGIIADISLEEEQH